MDRTSFDNRESKQRSGPWNKPWNIRKTEHARRKPDGGFRFIPALALMRAWWAYKQGVIRLLDLRVWLAIHETVSRRCGSSPNRFFRYTTEEIRQLIGDHKIASIQTSIQRLSNAGLLEWSEHAVRFPEVTPIQAGESNDDWHGMVDLVTNNRRKVPVPRRTIRFLAGLTRPVMIATVLGHLLRCVYYRRGMCEPTGRCKASWVADVFGVDCRNVKAARSQLREMDWMTIDRTRQTVMNRCGAGIRVNLSWPGTSSVKSGESPPRRGILMPGSPPPRKNWKLSSRNENQKPHSARRIGACARPSPSINRVRPEDLQDPVRLDELFAQAQAGGFVLRGTAARLRFHAAAAHAIRVGKQNPPGLFAAIVRRGLWSHICAADEELARCRMAGGRAHGRLNRCAGSSVASPGASPIPARLILQSIMSSLTAGRGETVHQTRPVHGSANSTNLVHCPQSPRFSDLPL